jgi:hypothetical protein
VWLRRGKGEACLKKWEEILLSGRFDTDQQSLDAAELVGACTNMLSYPTSHRLFALEYSARPHTSGQTFIHLTAAGRPEDTDYFYREIVVPRIRNSLHPPLNPKKLVNRKVCAWKSLGGGGTAAAATSTATGTTAAGSGPSTAAPLEAPAAAASTAQTQ